MLKKGEILASSDLRRKRFFLKMALFAGVFLFLSAGVSALFYVPKFRVQNVSVRGNAVLSGNEIAAEVSDALNGRYYGIFPRGNILLVPKEEIISRLLSAFPRIKKVSLDRDFPDSLIVNITERKPAALFCGEEPEEPASPPTSPSPGGNQSEPEGGCSFIGEDGAVFEKAADFSGSVYVKFYGKKNTKKVPFFEKLARFAAAASGEGADISKVVFGKDALREFYSSEGWRVLLNEGDDFEKAAANLKLALEEQIKEKRKNLDYIDLRFGKKVYYKFK